MLAAYFGGSQRVPKFGVHAPKHEREHVIEAGVLHTLERCVCHSNLWCMQLPHNHREADFCRTMTHKFEMHFSEHFFPEEASRDFSVASVCV